MRRRLGRCPAAGSECTVAAPPLRWWRAPPARAERRRPGAPNRSGSCGRRDREHQRDGEHAQPLKDAQRTRFQVQDELRVIGIRQQPRAGQKAEKIRSTCRHQRREDGVRSVDLLGDILERGVANVLAVHHVDHVFADVLGVIADALQRAHDPHDLEGAADGARILHHERDALALDGLVFLVHHLVLLRGLQAPPASPCARRRRARHAPSARPACPDA